MPHTIGFIFAHPDDETFGSSCFIRRLADEGDTPVLLLATRGEAGKTGRLGEMTRQQLALRRDMEMEQAGAVLGLATIENLGHPDSGLASVDRTAVTEQIVDFICRQQVEAVVTFPLDGMNGHPDHVAIHHAVKEAVMSGRCPSMVKMYYNLSKALEEAGISPTLRMDTEPHWAMKAKALKAHESQILSIERVFGDLTACPADRRYERLVLAWERGKEWPRTQETWITDRL